MDIDAVNFMQGMIYGDFLLCRRKVCGYFIMSGQWRN